MHGQPFVLAFITPFSRLTTKYITKNRNFIRFERRFKAQRMDFWPEFLASSYGKEFVAGGCGGVAGIIAGYPLDTVRIKQQSGGCGSAFSILRNVASKEGPLALYRGMSAPLASVTFQNALVFQCYASLSRLFDPYILTMVPPSNESIALKGTGADAIRSLYTKLSHVLDPYFPTAKPPSYESVALGGTGAGAIQSLVLTPIELVKIRLQLETSQKGPLNLAKHIIKTEGWKGMFRGLKITAIRDAPSHGFYFWTYEYAREKLHPGCRKNGHESFTTMLMAGGLAGVASWVCCYPVDVVKTRLQGQTPDSKVKYNGIVDCFRKSVKNDGVGILFRGLTSAVCRAFVVNGAVFVAYESALRCFF